jgi:hypothetical protein
LRRARLLVAAGGCVAVLATLLGATPAQAGWTTSRSVVPGRFADAEVFRLPDGRYRMLYGTESEVGEDKFGIYSSVSRDGVTWQSEGRVLAGKYSGASVVGLPSGGYRLYVSGPVSTSTEPGMGAVVGLLSYTSTNGATWQREPGVRMPDTWLAAGEHLGFTSTKRLTDGSWLMAYEVQREGRYAPNLPTGLAEIRWATSPDGLTFTRRGVAVSSKNSVLLGSARSPEFFGAKLYFHSLKGIYRVSWTGTGFAKDTRLEYSACRQPGHVFPWTPPPADPTLARIGDRTVLFHGDHARGIFRTTAQATANACFVGRHVPGA